MFTRLFITVALGISFNYAQAAYTYVGKINHTNQPYEGSVSIVSNKAFKHTNGRIICNAWLSKTLPTEARETQLIIQYADAFNYSSQPA